jgi:ParB family chromosome partitioning protein
MPIELLTAGMFQPRTQFKDDALEELAQSIKNHGVLQPLLVRPINIDEDKFEIIAGERRWRAAQKAQLHEVPVIVQEMSDSEALEIGLIENLQRQDLSPIEEARAYKQLLEDFGHTQERLADVVGKSRSHLANTMRLLSLPEDVQDFVLGGQLSSGHARALINADDPSSLAKKIIKSGLSVRQTEKLASQHGVEKRSQKTVKNGATKSGKKSADVLALEDDIKRVLGLDVSIDTKTPTAGNITIAYENLEQLDSILEKLMQQ